MSMDARDNAIRILKEALCDIEQGSVATGRWILHDGKGSIDGNENSGFDDIANWEPYTREEQEEWLSSVAAIAREALKTANELLEAPQA